MIIKCKVNECAYQKDYKCTNDLVEIDFFDLHAVCKTFSEFNLSCSDCRHNDWGNINCDWCDNFSAFIRK